MKHINPRSRKHRVTLLRINEDTLDSGGNPVPTEEAIGVYWARISTRKGFESVSGNQVHAHLMYNVFLPSDSLTRTITAKDKLRFEGRTFEIAYAQDIDLNQLEVEIGCKEIVA